MRPLSQSSHEKGGSRVVSCRSARQRTEVMARLPRGIDPACNTLCGLRIRFELWCAAIVVNRIECTGRDTAQHANC